MEVASADLLRGQSPALESLQDHGHDVLHGREHRSSLLARLGLMTAKEKIKAGRKEIF